MTPYEVLGIDENTSKEEVKEAYRAMIRKYHSDKFANTLEMKEIAEIKTREIIDAYHYILEHFNDGSSERSKEQEYQESTTSTHEENTYR